MAREGLESLFPLDATAVMGLREVVPAIPAHSGAGASRRRISRSQTHPDAVVVIDSPDFTHRIARAVKKRDPPIRTVNYVAPQVWASRAYRAKAMARYFDLVLALFPFEVPFFEKYGLQAAFVGHPVIERRARMTGGDGVARAPGHRAAMRRCWRCCRAAAPARSALSFPSSAHAVELLARNIPGLVTVLPTVPHVAAQGARGGHGLADAAAYRGKRGRQIRRLRCRRCGAGRVGHGDGGTGACRARRWWWPIASAGSPMRWRIG